MAVQPDQSGALLHAIEQFDLEDYLTDHGAVDVQKDEYVLQCPSCGKDKLIVNTTKKSWHCWVCEEFALVHTTSGLQRRSIGGTGGLLDLIQMLDEVDRKAAVAKVLAFGRLTTNDLEFIPEKSIKDAIHVADNMNPKAIPFPDNWVPVGDSFQARNFCAFRGITPADVTAFGLFCCHGGRYANRLVFPVYEGGKLVYYQARAMWDQRIGERYIKTLNPAFQEGYAVSSELLLNLDTARHFPRVCVVEGPIDCVHTGLDAVCSFGKKLSSVQIAKLMRAGVRSIDLMWDADAAKDAWAAARRLASLFDVRLVNLPRGDPGDYTRTQLDWYRSQGKNLNQGPRL